MTTRLIALFLTCLPLWGMSQWVELYKIPVRSDFIAMDNLLNIYSVSQSELFKYDKNGVFQFRFSDKQLGDIGEIDITFPLRPLVVYPEINYITILDNTLSDNRGKRNLLDHDIALATAACTSIQNHYWIYDAMAFSLVRLDEGFKKILETGNLSQILGIELAPNFMVEFANRLYVNNPQTGILVFDIFGTYMKTIPIPGLVRFQVTDGGVIYFKENSIYKYDPVLFQTTEFILPSDASFAVMQKNRVALVNSEEIVVIELAAP